MDCADSPRGVETRYSHEIEIEGTVADSIAKGGYHSQFMRWLHAVRVALQRHSIESAFEFIVSDSDRDVAREMGIRLD